MKICISLLLAGILLCLAGSSKAQTTNDTDVLEPTCPPPRTCPPQPICTCPSIAECPTEGTRTRSRSPGRTRGTRTETNRTRTDTTTGMNRTRTRTDTRSRRPRTKTRRRCVPKVPKGCPKVTTAPPIITTTMAETTSTDAGITTTEQIDVNATTTESTDVNITTPEATTTIADITTTEPFNVTEATTTEATTTEDITIDMNTTEPFDFNVTEDITIDMNTTEPLDFNITEATTATTTEATTTEATTTEATTTEATTTEATTTEATTTEATTTEATTTEASTAPPLPPTTQSRSNMSATCSSPIVDVTGQKEPPIRVFQFLVERHNLLEYAHEATDLVEFIAWLVKLSNTHNTVRATLLGLSGHQSGLSVIIAVSFTVTPGTNYTYSSSYIIETIYNHLDQLKVYYDVVDIKLVSMTVQSYSPRSENDQTEHRVVVTKPVVVLSVLAMVGLLGTVGAVSAKLMKRYRKAVPGEKRPLLEDRADGQRGFTLEG